MKKLSLRALLKELKTANGLTMEEIGEAAGLKNVKKGQAVYFALTRNEQISFALADWIINSAFGEGTLEDKIRAQRLDAASSLITSAVDLLRKNNWDGERIHREVCLSLSKALEAKEKA